MSRTVWFHRIYPTNWNQEYPVELAVPSEIKDENFKNLTKEEMITFAANHGYVFKGTLKRACDAVYDMYPRLEDALKYIECAVDISYTEASKFLPLVTYDNCADKVKEIYLEYLDKFYPNEINIIS